MHIKRTTESEGSSGGSCVVIAVVVVVIVIDGIEVEVWGKSVDRMNNEKSKDWMMEWEMNGWIY